MAERKVIVEVQLSDKNAVAELGRLQTETRQYQQSLKLLNSIVDENGKATNRQKQQIGELVAKIENNRVQYRELKNDISGATAAGLRFRDKMAEASLEALKQSGILGKLDAQQATLTQEVQKNTAVIAANEVAMKELRAEYQKGEFTTKEYKEQLKALKVESQAAEVANEKLGAELKDVSTQIGAMDAKVEALTADLKAGRITTEEFRRGVSSINDATNNAALSFDNGVKSLKAYALGFFGVVEGVQFLGRVVGDAIGTLRDQEKALSAVSSLGGEYEANIGRIAETTRTAGIAFGFTAVESTNAVEALAKAGVSVENILAGGLEGALTLAASGEVAVGDAAEYAAAAMSEFGLSGKDVTMIADTLTAAAVKAQGGVEDYGQALKFVGPVAAGLDVSLQETVGTLAEFAQAGVKGEQGGTSLRGVLSSLTSPSKAASEEMERLGIITAEGNNTLFDAQGKFKGLANLAERLRETTKDLTQEERAAAFGRIFGNQQLTAANILYEGGGKAIEEWTKQVTDSGLAAEIAAKKTDNLDGDINKLSSSYDALILKENEVSKLFRGFTQGLTNDLNALGEAKDLFEIIGSLSSSTFAASLNVRKELRENVTDGKRSIDSLKKEALSLTYNLVQAQAKGDIVTIALVEDRIRLIRKQIDIQRRQQLSQAETSKVVVDTTAEETTVIDAQAAATDNVTTKTKALTEAEKKHIETQREIIALANSNPEVLAVLPTAAPQQEAPTRPADSAENFATPIEDAANRQLEVVGMTNAELERKYQEDVENYRNAVYAKEQARLSEISSAAALAGSIGSLFEQQSDEFKAFATIEALISTYLAASQILGDPSLIGRPFQRFALSAAAIVTGLANVKRIQGFEEGGYTSKRSSDKQAVGVVHANEYVVPAPILRTPKGMSLVEELERLRMGHSVRFAPAYISGGAVGGASVNMPTGITSADVSRADLARAISSMPPPVVSVVDIANVQRSVAVTDRMSSL